MTDTTAVAELLTGLSISMTTLVSQLLAELRDVGAVTNEEASSILASLAEGQRMMADLPGDARNGQRDVYTAVANSLDAWQVRFTESSSPSP